ncbi:MAG: DnaJ domain-containing protein [Spirochaetales bacterium]|nr:DnaJ domain-containing protein [Spirochaetales bacterium]
MKNLYANLLSIQLDCEQLYEDFFNKALEFDFGLKAYDEFQEVRQFLTLEKAFEVLGIDQEATRDEIKNAFRRLAKKLHPDINPEADLREFILTEKAYKLALNRDTTHKTLA